MLTSLPQALSTAYNQALQQTSLYQAAQSAYGNLNYNTPPPDHFVALSNNAFHALLDEFQGLK